MCHLCLDAFGKYSVIKNITYHWIRRNLKASPHKFVLAQTLVTFSLAECITHEMKVLIPKAPLAKCFLGTSNCNFLLSWVHYLSEVILTKWKSLILKPPLANIFGHKHLQLKRKKVSTGECVALCQFKKRYSVGIVTVFPIRGRRFRSQKFNLLPMIFWKRYSI